MVDLALVAFRGRLRQFGPEPSDRTRRAHSQPHLLGEDLVSAVVIAAVPAHVRHSTDLRQTMRSLVQQRGEN